MEKVKLPLFRAQYYVHGGKFNYYVGEIEYADDYNFVIAGSVYEITLR